MTAILLFTTFVSFLVVERFSNKEAAIHELQAAFRAETGAGKVQSMVAPLGTSIGISAVASNQTSQQVPEYQFQLRAGNDRRRGERRAQRDQSAA